MVETEAKEKTIQGIIIIMIMIMITIMIMIIMIMIMIMIMIKKRTLVYTISLQCISAECKVVHEFIGGYIFLR